MGSMGAGLALWLLGFGVACLSRQHRRAKPGLPCAGVCAGTHRLREGGGARGVQAGVPQGAGGRRRGSVCTRRPALTSGWLTCMHAAWDLALRSRREL